MFDKTMDKANTWRKKFTSDLQTLKLNPTTREEEDSHFRLAFRLLNLTLYSMGGFYIGKHFSKRSKYMFAAWNIFALTALVPIGNTYYVMRLFQKREKLDIFDIFGSIAACGGCLVTGVFLPAFTGYYRKNIWETWPFWKNFRYDLDKMKLELENPALRDKISGYGRNKQIESIFRPSNILKFPVYGYLVFCIGALAYNGAPLLNYCVFYRNQRPPGLRDYNVIPYNYDKVQSFNVYFPYALMLFCIIIPIAITTVSLYPFFNLLGSVIFYNARALCHRMDELSHNFKELFEWELCHGEDATRDRLILAFEHDFRALTKEYQRFYDNVMVIHAFLNSWCSTFLSMGYVPLIAITALIVTVKLNPFQTLSFTWMLIIYLTGIFIICECGKTFEDTNELLRYTMYNFPWYHLPPRSRKLVHIAQCLVHNEIELKILWVYPINMATFPRMFNSAFSYANILRARNMK